MENWPQKVILAFAAVLANYILGKFWSLKMIKNKYFRMGVLMKKLIIIPAYNEEENISVRLK